jgi:hypothetical protein
MDQFTTEQEEQEQQYQFDTTTNTWKDKWAADTSNTISNKEIEIDAYKKMIENLTEHIALDTLINVNEYDMIDKLKVLINNKFISNEVTDMYNNMIYSFEKYDLMYLNKFKDLYDFIIESIKPEEKKTLLKNEYGEYILMIKPRLEREYRRDLYVSIENDKLYKLISSIKLNMKNIRNYENTFLYTSSNNISVSK